MVNKKNNFLYISLISILMSTLILTSCTSSMESIATEFISETETISNTVVESDSLASNWSEETHSKDAEPNYDVVFNQEEVLELTITIDPESWNAMQSDLAENMSSSTTGRGQRSPSATKTEVSDYTPVWVTSTITFQGDVWENVGIRFKGNSSLTSAYQSGNGKLSFKLDFDEFEDEYTEIEDQRFYGFKQLNLNNNFNDSSLLREKVAADLFRDYGLVSAQTSFCAVYVDYGEGSQYFGLYTIVEEMDDTVIESQFGDDSGNLYKPDGDAASFTAGSFDQNEMEKKNNLDENDYSDVQALYDMINSDLRTSNLETWQSELESIFNVDGFLKWLAVNTVIQNWDTYGIMTHNYYLYNDPDSGLINWIPWDNNEAFSNGKQGGALSLGLTEVNDNWPLISYITEVPYYKAIYDNYLEGFVDEVFNESYMNELYDTYAELISPYAYAEESGYTYINSNQTFDAAIETLKSHILERNNAVDAYLD